MYFGKEHQRYVSQPDLPKKKTKIREKQFALYSSLSFKRKGNGGRRRRSDNYTRALLDLIVGALVDLIVGALVDLIVGAFVDLIVGAFVDLTVGALVDLWESARPSSWAFATATKQIKRSNRFIKDFMVDLRNADGVKGK